MKGVTEFRSMEYAKECRDKAEKRLKKTKSLLVPAIGLSAITLMAPKIIEVFPIFDYIAAFFVICNFAHTIYTGSIFYILKFGSLTYRFHSSILGMIVSAWLLGALIWTAGFAPVVLALYEIYICKVTIECANDWIL